MKTIHKSWLLWITFLGCILFSIQRNQWQLPKAKSWKEVKEYAINQLGKDKPNIKLNQNQLDTSSIWSKRKEEIIDAVRICWNAYREDAFGKDEYRPLTKDGYNFGEYHSIGYILIDSLDTLLLTGLKDEFNEVRNWLIHNHTFNIDVDVSVFESNIRLVGGLLSTFVITEDIIFLWKAFDLAERLLSAFETNSKLPLPWINLKKRIGIRNHLKTFQDSTLADIGTLQLEFKYLSYLTGDLRFQYAANWISNHLLNQPSLDGLLPITIDVDHGVNVGSKITLGAGGDSYYEYLLKQWLQTSLTEPKYRDAYDRAMHGLRKHLLKKLKHNRFIFIGDRDEGVTSSRMQHLTCFVGGMLALGATNGKSITSKEELSVQQREDLELAEAITETCWHMYEEMESGLSAEAVHFIDYPNWTFMISDNDAFCYLRPETVESLFILWRITHNLKYREWGWKIFEALKQHASVPNNRGFTSIQDVRVIPTVKRNHLETFFISETLKYLYLLFEDDESIFPLDQFVFNTEAHPLPIFHPDSS